MADPTSIAGLVDWWTSGAPGSPTRVYSDAGITLVNADAQTVQRVVGVNNNQFNQATAANKPKWNATLGCIEFEDGAIQFLTENGLTIDRRSFTAFAVLEFMSLRNDSDGAGGQGIHMIWNLVGALNLYFQRVGSGMLSVYDFTSTQQSSNFPLTTSRILLVFTGGAASASVIWNGTSIAFTTLANGTGNGNLHFGAAGAIPSGPMNARVFDWGLYDHQLSAGDLSTLLTWAQTSRGVQSSYTSNVVFDGDSESVSGNMNRNWIQQLGLPVSVRQVCLAEPSLPLSTMLTEAFPDHWLLGGGKDIAIIWGGTNDFALGGDSEATVLAHAKTYNSNRKSAPFNKVIVLGMLPRPTGSTFTQANWSAFNSDLRTSYDAATLNADAVVDLAADPNIGPWGANTNATYYFADQVHVNNAGAAIVANLVYPFLAPMLGLTTASYTITGAASGTDLVTSSPFTCSLVGGCTFNGTQKVTITCPAGVTCTATAPGGTITNNGTGAVTVQPAAGQTGFTFTLLPTVAGTLAISFTNNQRGWTNPANLNFVVTGVPANPMRIESGKTGGYCIPTRGR